MPAKSCSFARRRMALAVAALCTSLFPAWGEVSVTGSLTSGPIFATPGPGNSVLPTTGVWVGNPRTGLLTGAGSLAELVGFSVSSDI